MHNGKAAELQSILQHHQLLLCTASYRHPRISRRLFYGGFSVIRLIRVYRARKSGPVIRLINAPEASVPAAGWGRGAQAARTVLFVPWMRTSAVQT